MSEEKKTEMIAPQPAGKRRLVKIKAITPIRVPSGKDFATVEPGTEVEVEEDVAAEYCDKSFHGMYSFGGERPLSTATRHVVKRAVRVA